MARAKGGTAGTDQSNSNARSRDPDRFATTVRRQTGAALDFARSPAGRGILAGIAALAAGFVASRDRRVRDAAADALGSARDTATAAFDRAKAAVNERVRGDLPERKAPLASTPLVAAVA